MKAEESGRNSVSGTESSALKAEWKKGGKVKWRKNQVDGKQLQLHL